MVPMLLLSKRPIEFSSCSIDDWRERDRVTNGKKKRKRGKGRGSIFHAVFSNCSPRVERRLLNRLLRVFVRPVDIIIERIGCSGDEIE